MEARAIMPLWDYMILELEHDAESRIIRPNNADPYKVGTLELLVISIGPDVRNIKPGDKLIFDPEAAVTLSVDDKQYWLVSERCSGAIVGQQRKINPNPDGRMPSGIATKLNKR